MNDETESDKPVMLAPLPPTRSVRLVAEYLVKVVDDQMGTRNGKTAFYWNLIHVIQQHAGRKEGPP